MFILYHASISCCGSSFSVPLFLMLVCLLQYHTCRCFCCLSDYILYYYVYTFGVVCCCLVAFFTLFDQFLAIICVHSVNTSHVFVHGCVCEVDVVFMTKFVNSVLVQLKCYSSKWGTFYDFSGLQLHIIHVTLTQVEANLNKVLFVSIPQTFVSYYRF